MNTFDEVAERLEGTTGTEWTLKKLWAWYRRARLHVCLICTAPYRKTLNDGKAKYCPDCRFTISMCGYCLSDFSIKQKDINDGRGRFCSRRCALALYALSPIHGAKHYAWIGGIDSAKMRRWRLAGAVGSFTKQQWEQLKARFNYSCLSCNKREPAIALSIDHVIPLKHGGSNDISNIQPLCLPCNIRKGVSSIDYRLINLQRNA